MAYDEETGVQAYKEVVRLFRNETTEWYHIHVNGEDIACTAEHPFYVADRKEFLPARELKIGDRVLLSDGKYGIVKGIGHSGRQQFVDAMRKGPVGKYGQEGIKSIGAKVNGKFYQYEIKVLKGIGKNYRVYGNFSDEVGTIVFDLFGKALH